METLEGAKEPVGVGRVKSGAVVADEVGMGAVPFRDAEFNGRLRALRREFPGVAQQVFENDPQETRVRHRLESIFDLKLDWRSGWVFCSSAAMECAKLLILSLST